MSSISSAQQARAAPLVGQLLAERYHVEALLGEGGMGAVYRARHVQLQKIVALKVLHAHMTMVDEAVARFEREAIASARINHPNVVIATDFGRLSDGSFFLVLEYVHGHSLSEVLKGGALLPRRALHIAKQIARALVAAHAEGIIHRDLKPDNVMLIEKEGDLDFVKVLDFGIAKVQPRTPDAQALTQLGTVFGTPQYMSPEQAAGKPVDQRTDIYALGTILYEMLAGKAPFDADDLIVMLTRQMTEPPPPLPKTIEPKLANLVLTALAKDPDQRPQTALKFERELDLLSSNTIARVGRTISMWPERSAHRVVHWLDTPIKRVAWLSALAGLLLGLVIIGRHLQAAVPSVSSIAAGTTLPDVAELLAKARSGDEKALAELANIATNEQSVPHHIAVAQANLTLNKPALALTAYTEAVKLEPRLVNDPMFQADLRRLASDPITHAEALDLAATKLGSVGVDLVIDVWLGEQGATAPARYAKKLLEGEARKAASAAGELAILLREAKSCASFKELLPRVKLEADERSLVPLRKLQKKGGCGFLGLEDCYSCLRAGKDLAESIAAAEGRAAPKLARTPQPQPSASATAN